MLDLSPKRWDHKPKLFERKKLIRNPAINYIHIFECNLSIGIKDRFLWLMWLLHQNEINNNFDSICNNCLFSISLSRWSHNVVLIKLLQNINSSLYVNTFIWKSKNKIKNYISMLIILCKVNADVYDIFQNKALYHQ